MTLGIDATLLYDDPTPGDNSLSASDLKSRSPYNTRVHAGLPPTRSQARERRPSTPPAPGTATTSTTCCAAPTGTTSSRRRSPRSSTTWPAALAETGSAPGSTGEPSGGVIRLAGRAHLSPVIHNRLSSPSRWTGSTAPARAARPVPAALEGLSALGSWARTSRCSQDRVAGSSKSSRTTPGAFGPSTRSDRADGWSGTTRTRRLRTVPAQRRGLRPGGDRAHLRGGRCGSRLRARAARAGLNGSRLPCGIRREPQTFERRSKVCPSDRGRRVPARLSTGPGPLRERHPPAAAARSSSAANRSGEPRRGLLYRPSATPLMARAPQAGAVAFGGLGLLLHQAAPLVRAWTGREPPIDRDVGGADAELPETAGRAISVLGSPSMLQRTSWTTSTGSRRGRLSGDTCRLSHPSRDGTMVLVPIRTIDDSVGKVLLVKFAKSLGADRLSAVPGSGLGVRSARAYSAFAVGGAGSGPVSAGNGGAGALAADQGRVNRTLADPRRGSRPRPASRAILHRPDRLPEHPRWSPRPSREGPPPPRRRDVEVRGRDGDPARDRARSRSRSRGGHPPSPSRDRARSTRSLPRPPSRVAGTSGLPRRKGKSTASCSPKSSLDCSDGESDDEGSSQTDLDRRTPRVVHDHDQAQDQALGQILIEQA